MKNKKGFTLVELLAVIVILGILLLIAVPAVQNIIENSRKKAFESAAKLALENVQQLVSFEKTSGESFPTCYIPIKQIKLERGSYGDDDKVHGFVYIINDGTIRIYYSNGIFKSDGGTLDDIKATKTNSSVDDTPQGAINANVDICSFISN